MCATATDDQVHWAYVVGGNTDVFLKARRNLFKIGINVSGHCSGEAKMLPIVPKSTSLIIILTDLISHKVADKARSEATRLDIPLVAGKFRTWHEIQMRLRNRQFTNEEIVTPLSTAVVTTVGGEDQLSTTIGEHIEYQKSKLEPLPIEAKEDMAPPEQMDERRARKAKQDAVLKQIFENHKHELATFTNYEAADEYTKLTGLPISGPGAVSDYRNRNKIQQTPKGYKRPGIRRKNREAAGFGGKVSPPKVKVQIVGLPSAAPTTTADQAVTDFDTIQSLLDEWALKHQMSTVTLTFGNGEWEMEFERIAVVKGGKTYKKGKNG